MAAGKWNTENNVRARCQQRARSRGDAAAAHPKEQAKRASRCARKTAERRADCARQFARDCDARTDTRIVQDADRLRRGQPPRYGFAGMGKVDGEAVVAHPMVMNAMVPAPVYKRLEDGQHVEVRDDNREDYDDVVSDWDSDEDYDFSGRVQPTGKEYRLEELVEDTGFIPGLPRLPPPKTTLADVLRGFAYTEGLSLLRLSPPDNLPKKVENAWRKAAALAVVKFRFDAEGRPLDEDGEQLTVPQRDGPGWAPPRFRSGRIIDNFHPSHMSMGERMNLFDQHHGIIPATIRAHQRKKGEMPSFDMKWLGHLECGTITPMGQDDWRYQDTVDWGELTYDNWRTKQRWYVPSTGRIVRDVYLEARPRECPPKPDSWRTPVHPVRGLVDAHGDEMPEFTYHPDQYNGPQHYEAIGVRVFLYEDAINGNKPQDAWQMPFGPLRDAFDEWCEEHRDGIEEYRIEQAAITVGRDPKFLQGPGLSIEAQAFLLNGGSGAGNPALAPVLNAIWEEYRIDEFLAQIGIKLANFFYEHRSRWRTTVASWSKKRAVAHYWQETTQARLCAPGGTGRAADAAEFAAEFEEEWSEC